jgi:predicted aspartyl protease
MRRAALGALAGLLVLTVLAAIPRSGSAQFYRWVDERGNNHYTEGLDNVPEPHRADAILLDYRNTAPPPPGPPGARPAAETVINFTPGRHIIVDARVNGTTSAKLILDTGAGKTLLSPRVLAAAGVSLTRGTVPVRARGVASGTDVDVQLVVVDSLAVGEARVGRMVVSSYEMNMPDVDGLLGQDFLSRFRVTIDSSRGVVTLGPR